MKPGAGTPRRSCAVCRLRRPPAELVPIRVVNGRWGPGRATRGKGAWICPDRKCLENAARSRLVKTSSEGLDGLAAEVRRGLSEELLQALRRAHAAGIVLGGRKDVLAALEDRPLALVLVAKDAGARIHAIGEHARVRGVPVGALPWSAAEVGRAIGRGPRSLLGVLGSRLGIQFAESLRRFEKAG